MGAFFVFMYFVYILYSPSSGKSYVGYTSNIGRRMEEHNHTERKGFTLRYRPWVLFHSEAYETKAEATAREKFYKSGAGRCLLKEILQEKAAGI